MKALRFFTILLSLLTITFSELFAKSSNSTSEMVMAGYQIVEIDMHNMSNSNIDFAWVAVVICCLLVVVHQILSKQKMQDIKAH